MWQLVKYIFTLMSSKTHMGFTRLWKQVPLPVRVWPKIKLTLWSRIFFHYTCLHYAFFTELSFCYSIVWGYKNEGSMQSILKKRTCNGCAALTGYLCDLFLLAVPSRWGVQHSKSQCNGLFSLFLVLAEGWYSVPLVPFTHAHPEWLDSLARQNLLRTGAKAFKASLVAPRIHKISVDHFKKCYRISWKSQKKSYRVYV